MLKRVWVSIWRQVLGKFSSAGTIGPYHHLSGRNIVSRSSFRRGLGRSEFIPHIISRYRICKLCKSQCSLRRQCRKVRDSCSRKLLLHCVVSSPFHKCVRRGSSSHLCREHCAPAFFKRSPLLPIPYLEYLPVQPVHSTPTDCRTFTLSFIRPQVL